MQAIEIANFVVAENKRINESMCGDDEADVICDDLSEALGLLALKPAMTLEDVRAKAIALQTCLKTSFDYPPEVEGDNGLAASFIADVLRLLPPN